MGEWFSRVLLSPTSKKSYLFYASHIAPHWQIERRLLFGRVRTWLASKKRVQNRFMQNQQTECRVSLYIWYGRRYIVVVCPSSVGAVLLSEPVNLAEFGEKHKNTHTQSTPPVILEKVGATEKVSEWSSMPKQFYIGLVMHSYAVFWWTYRGRITCKVCIKPSEPHGNLQSMNVWLGGN